MSAKRLQKKLEKFYGDIRFDLYKGHTMDGDYGWIVRKFGGNENFLGRNLEEAYESYENMLLIRELVAWENRNF